MRKIYKFLSISFFIQSVISEKCSHGEICEVHNHAEIQNVVNIFNSNIDNIMVWGGCWMPPGIEYEF